jgi:hypothetical protein
VRLLNKRCYFFGIRLGRLAIVCEYLTIKRRWDAPQLLIALYLKYWRNLRGISIEEIDKKIGYSYTAGHWFRLDFGWWGKGGSIPRPTDWIKLKDLLKFDGLYATGEAIATSPIPAFKNLLLFGTFVMYFFT